MVWVKQVAQQLKSLVKKLQWVPATAMYPNTTNGCADLAQVELSMMMVQH